MSESPMCVTKVMDVGVRARRSVVCLEAFAATKFGEIFSGLQPRQRVKIIQRFRESVHETLENVYTSMLGRYSHSLRAGRSGDRMPVGARFSAPVHTGPGAYPASYTMGTGCLYWG